MDPSIFGSLLGNLGISPDFSNRSDQSPNSNNRQRNKVKNGNQLVINVNGVQAEKRSKTKPTSGTYKEGYHAVFLDNNQVYFGKLQRFADTAIFMTLTGVYYLQTVDDSAVLNVDLVKLGTEIHSPEDKLHINMSHILFWEKLQDDGPIVTAILNSIDR
ncbi:MAG TPA: hypothetical protein VLF87_03945 [Patescibacteria group bacterium]|nr:hypothetical protein [Patescibacteria group bacterium]